ncbi:adenylate kinase [Arthrobacter oryzae]|uniref:adenylate kinase n=1 Tax=Arthrobacter oryzae TaxID=409290 RepID=UPI001ABFB029|nr:adenylate kinase [Arthrobacter oryzae]
MTPSRVLFYGVTGSGKSSAARAYAEATGLPEFSVDECIGWLPGWEQRDAAEQRALGAAIVAQDRWVPDSAYGDWRDLVLARAELVVALDYPRWLSLSRLVRRTVRRIVTGQVVCNGNRETLARALAKDSVIRWHFQSFARKRRVIRDMQAGRDLSAERDARTVGDRQAARDLQGVRDTPSVIVFRRPRELEAWLEAAGTGTGAGAGADGGTGAGAGAGADGGTGAGGGAGAAGPKASEPRPTLRA